MLLYTLIIYNCLIIHLHCRINGFLAQRYYNDGDIEEFTLKSKNIDPQDHKETLRYIFSELEIFKGTECFVVRK